MTLLEYSEYAKLKNQVMISIGNSERYSQLLSTLKELFRESINSPRRFEKITNIRHLLNVLEVRDVLSENNVAPLKEIARRLPNSNDLLQKINEYEANHIPINYINYYVPQNLQTTPKQPDTGPAETTFISSNPNASMSARKKQRIVDTVVEDIGVFWRDLARSLDIKEKVIDDLNDSSKGVAEKTIHIMELFNAKADDNTWFFDLCDALETCRRKDLVKKLKRITVTNI